MNANQGKQLSQFEGTEIADFRARIAEAASLLAGLAKLAASACRRSGGDQALDACSYVAGIDGEVVIVEPGKPHRLSGKWDFDSSPDRSLRVAIRSIVELELNADAKRLG